MCDRPDCDGTHYRTTRDDGRCPHGEMWGHSTAIMGRDGVPPCERCRTDQHEGRATVLGCALCLAPAGRAGGHGDEGMRRTCEHPRAGYAETTTIHAPAACPCGEPTRPARYGDRGWIFRGDRSVHLDGEPLCPVMGPNGYVPADHPAVADTATV